MKYDIMIIIDMQSALLEEHPSNEKAVIENIKILIENCRLKNIPVLYVQHDGGIGDELEFGTNGWEIYRELKPLAQDKIISKQYNSAFRKTELKDYLDSIQAKKLIMCGMQTEYCLDVSCKVAFEFEYQVTIPQNATTTFDNDFGTGREIVEFYEEKIWNHRYAEVLPVEEIIKNITTCNSERSLL